MLITNKVLCPYCNSEFETQLDCSVEFQEYIEDCYVCCSPIVFSVSADIDGNLIAVTLKPDNE